MKAIRKILRYLPFFALVIVALVAEASESNLAVPAPFEKVRAYRDGEVFSAELQTAAAWNGSDVQVVYETDGVLAHISNAFLNNGKLLVRFEDRSFRSFQATQEDSTTVRAKFYTKKGVNGKAFDGRFRARRSGNNVIFEIVGDPADDKTAKAVTDEVRNVAVIDEETGTESLTAKLVAGAAASVAPTATAPAEEATSATPLAATAAAAIANDESTPIAATAVVDGKKINTAKLSEDQIPVLQNAKEAKKAEGNGFFKIMTTLSVLAIALGAAAFGLKRWSAKNGAKNNKHKQIKVLTSHSLGPKKNLMVVQVAGETLLLGVTDQNISMLKTLSLLDEEIPESVPQRFDHSMDDFIEDEEEPIALRGLNDIRDTVSSRLKNMRNL